MNGVTKVFCNYRILSKLLNAATSKRNKLILALLVGAGLRRAELVTLRYSDVETLGERTVLNVQGKGDKL